MTSLFEWLVASTHVSNGYDTSTVQFFLSLGVGGLIVFLFAMNRFGETPIGGDDDLIAKFPTKFLATRDEYARAMIVYITTMLVVLVAFSVLGPGVLKIGGYTPPAAVTPVLPLVVALVLVGVIPKIRYLHEIEHNLRQFARERAYIPATTLAIADRMAAADFDYAPYQERAILALPAMAGVARSDFARPRGSLEYSWARLCVLSYELHAGKAAAIVGPLGKPLLKAFEKKRQTLANDVVKSRDQERKGRGDPSADLHGRIREMVRAYHILLACAVRQKLDPGADVALELGHLGFVREDSHEPVSERGNLIVGGLGVMAACLFLLVMMAASLSGLWHASLYFPTSALDAFIWCLSAVSAHGVAILLADRMRARALARARWYRSDARGRTSPLANLIRVGVACGIGGYVVLVLWGALYQKEVSSALFKGMAAYAMMPATTGAFYAFSLDNIELRCRPSRWLEIAVQAAATAFFGLVACSAWFALVGDNPRDGYDLILMVTMFGAVIGGSLGWYIPAAVPQDPYDPVGEARAARVRQLEDVVRAHFNDANVALQWIDRACKQLGNRTPRAAAGESVDGYDDAIGVLAGPRSQLAA